MASTLNLSDLVVRPDEALAVSEWFDVSQARINQFAETTGDAQWIHTDPERAAKSPFRSTIAHGFLTLSLLTPMAASAMAIAGSRMVVNYGLNRVRFVAPVPAGSRIRARFAVADLTSFNGALQVTWDVTIERDGSEKSCCTAEWLVRYYT
jgi:acyl dehydratase